MTKQASPPVPRVDVGADTISIKALVARAQVVGTMTPLTPLYTSNVAFKDETDAFVAAGVALSASETKVANLEAALTQARGDRDTAHTTCKSCHAVVATQVEKNSATPAALQSYGFLYQEIVKLGAVLPTGILWSYDHATSLLQIHVQYAGKARACLVEISPDPVTATSYRRLDGHGVKRSLTGYAPGTYWVHAATSLACGRPQRLVRAGGRRHQVIAASVPRASPPGAARGFSTWRAPAAPPARRGRRRSPWGGRTRPCGRTRRRGGRCR